MQKPINLASLGSLDGGSAELIIDKEISLAIADLDDRGDDEKARQVVVTLILEKKEGLIVAHVEAKCKMPPRRTGMTVARLTSRGGQAELMFQELSPEDPDQMTIDEETNR